MGYDDIDRLTTASGFRGSGSCSFDALGNILTKTESDIDFDYTYNSTTNLLTSIDDTVGSADYTFSHDAYGNVTNNGNQGFVYNLAGNMVSSTNPGITYKYDGHKRRVQKDDSSQISYTVYGQNGKLMHKRKGGVSTHYVYAGSLLIAELQGSTVNYVHTDLLGSPITGDNGTAYAEHYRPLGEKKDYPIQLTDDVGYTGHQNNVATGLTYMQARYYDPVVGRFMATDPVQFDGSNPVNFGRYIYANNSPFKFVDPDGRQSVGEMIDSGAEGCGPVSCAGWAALKAAWSVFGAEGVSQIYDKGTNAGIGNMAMAGIEVSTLGQGGKVGAGLQALKGVARFLGPAKRLSRQIAREFGRVGKATRNGLGTRFLLAEGKVTVRVMESGGQRTNYLRVSIEGKGSVDAAGKLSSDVEATHIPINQDSMKLIQEMVKRYTE